MARQVRKKGAGGIYQPDPKSTRMRKKAATPVDKGIAAFTHYHEYVGQACYPVVILKEEMYNGIDISIKRNKTEVKYN